MKKSPQPPRAKQKPVRLEKHGDIRIDPYYYLRERQNPEVIRYLEDENRYFEAVTRPIKPLQQALFDEMRLRIKDEDESVPYTYKNYRYQVRYPAGQDYPVYLRWPKHNPEAKQILLDANKRAHGHDYYQPASVKISPDDRTVAFGEDFSGRRLYEIRFRHLENDQIHGHEVLTHTTGSGVFSACGQYFFYVRKHPETLRAYRLYRHRMGTPPEEDKLIYEETDTRYDIHVSRSKTEAYIWLVAAANTTTEYRYIPANQPLQDFRLFRPRRHGTEYYPYHIGGDRFLVVSNEDDAENYQILLQQGIEQPAIQSFLPHRSDTLIEELEVFDTWLALTERHNGLTRLRIMDYTKQTDYYIDFPEETYTTYMGINAEMESDVLRYGYNSLTMPASVMEWNIRTRQSQILKTEEIPGGYDPSLYESRRIWVPARDGKQIPVSMVWRKDRLSPGGNPVLLYGYGAYGITVDDHFSRNRLSLLDRGFIFATAHVRGGEYLGRQWYEDGKLLKKKNTFYDFIDVARHLAGMSLVDEQHLYAMGGSAGGLLMGAVANMAPELFRGMVAQVPFVDVLTTMLDESIPLTTGEYDEWGNPHEKIYYDYIKSYSPYDNVAPRHYPHMLITTGLHDSQVQYWEPAKWTAKLRDMNTGKRLILLHTDMQTGHGGKPGRYASLEDTARDFAFLIHLFQNPEI